MRLLEEHLVCMSMMAGGIPGQKMDVSAREHICVIP